MSKKHNQHIYIPLKVAAPILDIPVSRLRKQIKEGNLKGFKTNVGYLVECDTDQMSDQYGQWLVSLLPDSLKSGINDRPLTQPAGDRPVGQKPDLDKSKDSSHSSVTRKTYQPPQKISLDDDVEVAPLFVIKPNKKVLVVDDQKFSRELVGDLVRTFGFEPYFAENGVKALDFLEDNFISIVMTDLEMPEMDGQELLRRIKDKYDQSDVVMITGNATVESAIEAMKSGAEDYLTKPVQADELQMLLERCRRRQILEFERYRLQVASRNLEKENIDLKKFLLFFEKSKHINTAFELNDLLEMIVKFSTVHTNALKGSLFLLNEKTGKLRLKSSKGIDPSSIKEFFMGEGLLGKVAQTGKPVLLAPPRPSRSGKDSRSLVRTIPSCIYVPLRMKNKTIGIMCVLDKLDGDVFDKMDMLLLKMLAEQAVVAIRNARMFKFAEEKTIKDPRTNLYSPYFFLEYLDKEIERACEDNVPFSVVIFAFHELESGIHTLSQKQWIVLKKQLSSIAGEALRKSDILAVWKRNRFALLLTNITDEAVGNVVHRLIKKIEMNPVIHGAIQTKKVSVAFSLLTRRDCADLSASDIVQTAMRKCQENLNIQ